MLLSQLAIVKWLFPFFAVAIPWLGISDTPFSLSAGTPCTAQAFKGNRITVTQGPATGSAIADFDNDGKLDIAIRTSSGGPLTVQLGIGNGYFGGTRLIDSTVSGFSVSAGDFNNDGKIDLLTPTKLFFGEGNGSFAAPLPLTLSPDASSYSSADFDGDDSLDLYARVAATNAIIVAFGNGQGEFSSPVAVPNSGATSSFEVVDIDRNGTSDIVATITNANTVAVMFGLPDGTFTTPALYPLGGSDSVNLIATGDIDGDGDLDIASANNAFGLSESFLVVLLNDGDNTFTVQPRQVGPTVGQSRMMIRDANIDGIADIIVNGGSRIAIALGDNTGNFQNRRDFPGHVGQGTMYYEDFTGDGVSDIAFSTGVPAFVVFDNDGNGGFGVEQLELNTNHFPTGAAVADFNEDGFPDIVWAKDTPDLEVGFGDGNGGIKSQIKLVTSATPRTVLADDVNNDGNIDIFIVEASSSSQTAGATFAYGDGKGSFGPFIGGATVGRIAARRPFLADLNGDGFKDLLTIDSNNTRITIHQNPGNTGSFIYRGVLSTGTTVGAMTAGDFDQDGNADIAILSFAAHIFLGNSNWAWDSIGAFPAGQANNNIHATDLTGDGIIDLVATAESTGPSPAPGMAAILIGLGKGGFSAPRQYLLGRGSSWIASGDLDADGNVDLAISNSGYSVATDTRASILYGDGAGNFPRHQFSTGALTPREIFIADFDSDSRPDVAVLDYNYATMNLLRNICLPPPPVVPALSSNADISIAEGDTTDATAEISVTLSAPSDSTVRVQYRTAPLVGVAGVAENDLVEASSPLDYRTISGELEFAPGQTSKTVVVTVRGDLLDEYNEKFSVSLYNSTNASIADNRTVVTITDNDLPPSVSIGAAAVIEGNTGTSQLAVPVTLSEVSGRPVVVAFTSGGGTAIPNQDYVRAEGLLTIPAGSASSLINVEIIGERAFEPDETFFVEISQPVNAILGNSLGTATITNDDIGGSVQFASAEYVVSENSSGIAIVVSRTGGNAGGVSVKFRTSAGTAQPGADYTETAATVLFAADETSRGVFIPILRDQLDEPDETVNLILEDPYGVTIGTPSPAILTIQSNSELPELRISDASVVEGDNGSRTIQFFVRLSRPTQRTVSVNYTTTDQTATAGQDYSAASGTFTIRPGVTRKALAVEVFGDFFFEQDETFSIDLSGVSNATLADPQAIGRIINDEIGTSASTQLVSVNSFGNGSGNSDSLENAIDAVGNRIAFESFASDLTSIPDANGARDIYLRDLGTQQTSLVSVDVNGTGAGNCSSGRPLISADGRHVAFTTCSTNIVSGNGGTQPVNSTFVRDIDAGVTRLVSVDSTGQRAEGEAMAISANGRFVVFQTRQPGITSVPDSPDSMDVFVRDMQLGVTKLVSANSSGIATANADSGVLSIDWSVLITPDGRFVLFPSRATDIVTINSSGLQTNLFVRDLNSDTTEAATVNAAGSALAGTSRAGSISDDGRYVYFESNSSEISLPDTDTVLDVFRRDLQTNSSELVSVNLNGNSSGNGLSKAPTTSGDGRYVAFSSTSTDMVATPTLSGENVFWRDMVTGTTRLVSVNAAGTRDGSEFSNTAQITKNGVSVLFRSAASDLVPEPVDNNALLDLYIRDMAALSTKPVSINESGTAMGNQTTMFGWPSANGDVVAYWTGASNLVQIDSNGLVPDVFAFRRSLPSPPLTDFDGDGKTDLSVFRPSNGTWHILNSSNGGYSQLQFGLSNDVPVPRDYDADGKTDVAVFREGVWYLLYSRTNTFAAITFGEPGDRAVPGDFDGDRRMDLAVYRQGTWFIKESSDGNVRSQQFGLADDIPVQSDFDGDRRDDIAVFRDGIWYIFQSTTFTVRVDQFGLSGDTAVNGDFDGDDRTDLAIFRPSNGVWFILNSVNGTSRAVAFGISTDIPLRGDFDGDGKNDIAVFREGVWYAIWSSDQSVKIDPFGSPGDKPLPR